jgi:NTP pyrophosphatase (non-canonical NTP hydrolase)
VANGGPYSIGSNIWPGLAKLVEECGEVSQVAGKIMAIHGAHDHWDGTNLLTRFQEELADVQAVIEFVRDKNPQLDSAHFNRRVAKKLAQFNHWHEMGQG